MKRIEGRSGWWGRGGGGGHRGKQVDQLALGEPGWGRNLILKKGWRGEKSSDSGIFLKHGGHDVGVKHQEDRRVMSRF